MSQEREKLIKYKMYLESEKTILAYLENLTNGALNHYKASTTVMMMKNSIKDYINQLQQKNQQLKEQKNKALNYIENYNSMEFRYQDSKVIDKLNIIKNILNNRLDFEDEDIEKIKLKKQLKQRDEVIDEAIDFIKKHSKQCLSNKENDISIIGNFMWHTDKLLEILQKYKGDSK